MKKILLILFLSFLIYAPFLLIKPKQQSDQFAKDVANKFECYPIENCKVDFNGDGKLDVFNIVDEPNDLWQHYYRLKIFIEVNNQPKEILNIRYELVGDNYRTHVAIFERFDRKELIIYDTINKEHFFFWDGLKLSPIWDGKQISYEEKAFHERGILESMALQDETGGLIKSKAIDSIFSQIFILYYFLLFLTVGMYFYFQRKLNNKLLK